jgi:hypothetical protein
MVWYSGNEKEDEPPFLGLACKEGKGHNYPIPFSRDDPPSIAYSG